MDRFTRNYVRALGVTVLIVAAWLLYEDPEVSRLNERFENDAELAAYPYRFRVLRIDNGVATVTTPRSPRFPAFRALEMLFPELTGKDVYSTEMIEAQKELARVQYFVRDIVLESEDVDSVRWELDEPWLRSQGIEPAFL